MSTETLQHILRYVETLDIPNGEYLNIATALKNIYEKETNKSIWTTYDLLETEAIQLKLKGCYTDNVAILNIKSISASNIDAPRPTSFKFIIEVNIYESDISDVPSKTYTMITNSDCIGKLNSLFNILGPRYITIKSGELEITYDCYKFLKEWKDRCIEEIKLDDDEDAELDTIYNDNTFRSIILDKIYMNCKSLFWTKHEELKEN